MRKSKLFRFSTVVATLTSALLTSFVATGVAHAEEGCFIHGVGISQATVCRSWKQYPNGTFYGKIWLADIRGGAIAQAEYGSGIQDISNLVNGNYILFYGAKAVWSRVCEPSGSICTHWEHKP